MVDYVYSTIDLNILAFIIGIFWGMLFELMLALIVGWKYN